MLRQHIKTGAGPLAELYKKNNQQKTNFKDQVIIPFIPSQRHISISHLLSPTHHPRTFSSSQADKITTSFHFLHTFSNCKCQTPGDESSQVYTALDTISFGIQNQPYWQMAW